MKRAITLLGILFLGIVSLNAAEIKQDHTTPSNIATYTEGIHFIEGNIQFSVFLNGSFTFEELGRRRYSHRNTLIIRRDHRGRIRRVGDVWIRYNVFGRVKRIGSVQLFYRGHRMVRIGNLSIQYNNYGIPRFYGQVRGYFPTYAPVVYSYYDAFFYNPSFITNYYRFREDAQFYYYKPRARQGSRKQTIIKRRKNTQNNTTRNGRRG